MPVSAVLPPVAVRAVVRLMTVLLAAIAATSAAAAVDEREIRAAETLFTQGRYAEAAQAYEQVLQKAPDLADAHRFLGHAYFQLGQFDRARQAYGQAIARGRLGADVLARLASIYTQTGQAAAAADSLKLATLVEPADRERLLNLADLLTAAGRNEEARALLADLSQRHPADARPLIRLGNLLVQAGRSAEALTMLQTAQALGASQPDLPRLIAELQHQAGDFAAAAIWYGRAADAVADPARSAQLRLRQAQAQFEAGDLAAAAAACQLLTASEDKTIAARANLLLGQIRVKEGKQDEAAALLAAAAVEEAPGVVDEFLASYYINTGNFAGAIPPLRRLSSRGQSDGSTHAHLVIALHSTGDAEAASAALKAYVERFGLDDRAKDLLARLQEPATR